MGLLPGYLARDYARSGHRPNAQPLASLSSLGLPRLGPFRVLPIRRSVWLSRPTAGCDGLGLQRSSTGAGADLAIGGTAIRGRRCPALVAPAVWGRRSHADHR